MFILITFRKKKLTIKLRGETWTEEMRLGRKTNGFEGIQSIITAFLFSTIYYFQIQHLHVQWKHKALIILQPDIT